MMQPNDLARQLKVSAHTLRRWCSEFASYLSPLAAPPKGNPRALDEHDQRVMFLVASLRAMGQEHDAIIQRLEKERENQWESLPELPPTFFRSPIPNVPIDQAASRAYEMAQAAALQTQIQYLQQQNQDLTSELESARTRVNELETELEKIRQDRAITERDLREELLAIERQKQTALLQAQAEVARLEGQLSGYSLGREKPLNVGLLLIGAVLFGVALVVVVFVIANLLG